MNFGSFLQNGNSINSYANCNFFTAIGMSFTFPLLKQFAIYGNAFVNAIHAGTVSSSSSSDPSSNASAAMGLDAGFSLVVPITRNARFEAGYAYPLYRSNMRNNNSNRFFWRFGISL